MTTQLELRSIEGGLTTYLAIHGNLPWRGTNINTAEVYSTLCNPTNTMGHLAMEPRWKHDGRFIDPWGQEYNLTIWNSEQNSPSGDQLLNIWIRSNGPNKADDNGKGDDITVGPSTWREKRNRSEARGTRQD